MTWLDLYKYLQDKANGINNLDPSFWSDEVTLWDAETGDFKVCDTLSLPSEGTEEGNKIVLAYNLESVYEENTEA